jgi:hypothetical protein
MLTDIESGPLATNQRATQAPDFHLCERPESLKAGLGSEAAFETSKECEHINAAPRLGITSNYGATLIRNIIGAAD